MRKIIIVITAITIIFFLYWHWKLGITRYFDADEFAHLHWGYSLSVGERPYTDFFYLFPPFFLYPVAFLFKIFGRTAEGLINARILMFSVFLFTSSILFLLVKKLKGLQTALLTVAVFAFLPLPFDKMMEIRPDLLATGLALTGLYLLIRGFGGGEGSGGSERKYFLLSGFCYAVSLGFVPKTVFFLVPVVIVFLISHLSNLSHLSRQKKEWFYFLLGMAPVGLLLLFLLALFANPAFGLYSMTRMAAEVTQTLGTKFYMRPDIFFYPNDTFYGFGGWSWPLIINLAIYVSAGFWAIHKLISLGTSTSGEAWGRPPPEVSVADFLIAGSFWANMIAFVYIYPLKHAQYLIPVVPFVAYYFADVWETVMSRLPKLLKSLRWMTTLILLFLLCLVGFTMNQKKELWVNTATLDKVSNFLKIIPGEAAVYDLSGESVFFKDGYYFCCLPYGQYAESLYFKVPDVETDTVRRGTKYVQLGWLGRLKEIPPRDAQYILDNFTPTTPDKTLLIRRDNN